MPHLHIQLESDGLPPLETKTFRSIVSFTSGKGTKRVLFEVIADIQAPPKLKDAYKQAWEKHQVRVKVNNKEKPHITWEDGNPFDHNHMRSLR